MFVPLIDCNGEIDDMEVKSDAEHLCRYCSVHGREIFSRVTLGIENSKCKKLAYVGLYISEKFAEGSHLSREDVAKLTLGRDPVNSIWVWTYARHANSPNYAERQEDR